MPLIRPLTAQDFDAWSALWQGYLGFYETTLPDAHFDNYFQRLLSNDAHDFHALVAETDGRLIGLTHYLFHRHGWKTGNVVYLQDLFVSPTARGTGAGRALIEAVYKAADDAGAESVYWLTQSHNETAQKIYDRIASRTDFIKYQR